MQYYSVIIGDKNEKILVAPGIIVGIFILFGVIMMISFIYVSNSLSAKE